MRKHSATTRLTAMRPILSFVMVRSSFRHRALLAGLCFTTMFSPIRHAYADVTVTNGSPKTYTSQMSDSSPSTVTIDSGGALTLQNFGSGNTNITNNGNLSVQDGTSTIASLNGSNTNGNNAHTVIDQGSNLVIAPGGNGTYTGTIDGGGTLTLNSVPNFTINGNVTGNIVLNGIPNSTPTNFIYSGTLNGNITGFSSVNIGEGSEVKGNVDLNTENQLSSILDLSSMKIDGYLKTTAGDGATASVSLTNISVGGLRGNNTLGLPPTGSSQPSYLNIVGMKNHEQTVFDGSFNTGPGVDANNPDGVSINITTGANQVFTANQTAYWANTVINTGGSLGLINNGSLPTSDVTITDSGSTLWGTGTVQSATVSNGGNLTPGVNNSGKLTVNNNLTMSSGSNLNLGVSGMENGKPVGSYVYVGGHANLAGTTIHLNMQNWQNPTIGEKYTAIVSPNQITSSNNTAVADPSLFTLGVQDNDKADDNYLLNIVLERNNTSFAAYAQSPNQTQTGQAASHLPFDNGASKAIIPMTDPAAVRGALDALSGEINASAKTAMINDSFNIQEAVIDRLDCAGDRLRARAHDGKQQTSGYCDIDPRRHLTVWGTVYGQQGGQSGGGGVAGMNQSTVGWIMGADTQLKGHWRVGGMLAYGRDWFGVQSGRSSSAHSNSATIGAYVGNAWRVGGVTDDAAITFKGGVSYSWNMLHTNRRVMFPGYNTRLSSNNRTGTGQVFAESGYRMGFGLTKDIPLEVEPFVRMTYLNYGNDSFREHGADAALNVKGQNSSIGFSTFGVKLASSVNIGRMVFSPHLGVGYRRAFGRTSATAREGFAALGGGYDMTVQGTPLSVSTAQINTGFAARLTDALDVNIDYIGQYGSRQTSTGGSGSFHYHF